ncbi:MAG: MMPL family transporter, partial [Chromatocurvus sp.]
PGGLMTPESMDAIARLRENIEALPLVANVSGLDSYISLMHSVLTDDAYGTLPTHARGPGQYLFLYETAGAPEDFKQVIDYDHTRALVRAQLSTDSYAQTKPVVESLEQTLRSWSAASGLQAQVSGRVAVNDGWMSQLAANHFIGLGMAAGLVLLTALAAFRSLPLATLAVLPVLVGVLAVYATMGALRIDIAPATSMTAAIATGLGVDFGIHLVFQMRHQLQARDDIVTALSGNYAMVARACFWSATSLGVALAVICLSSAPPLRWFGVLVSLGAFGSLIGALIIIPALTAFASLVSTRKLHYA